GSTVFAGALFFICIKPLHYRGKLCYNVRHFEKFFMKLISAVFTKPHKSIYLSAGPDFFYNKPHRIGSSLWRMRCLGWQKKNISFPDGDIYNLSVFVNPDINIPL